MTPVNRHGFGGFLGWGTEIFSLKCNTVGAVFPPPAEKLFIVVFVGAGCLSVALNLTCWKIEAQIRSPNALDNLQNA